MWLPTPLNLLPQKMKFPVVELVDRYAIALVKFGKTNGANEAEVEFYHAQMQELDVSKVNQQLDELIDLHYQIWGLEDDFKKYRESEYSLEEVGRRALKIRDMNQKRVALKNSMAEILGCGVREIKQDHLSGT